LIHFYKRQCQPQVKTLTFLYLNPIFEDLMTKNPWQQPRHQTHCHPHHHPHHQLHHLQGQRLSMKDHSSSTWETVLLPEHLQEEIYHLFPHMAGHQEDKLVELENDWWASKLFNSYFIDQQMAQNECNNSNCVHQQ